VAETPFPFPSQELTRMDSNTPAAAVELLSVADGLLAEADELGALVRRLHELDEEERIVVALHYLEGLGAGDIARVMDLEERVVERIFADATARLGGRPAGRGMRAA
jgi:DNA-directed RNA polymerase specialized sigma24 family protein